MQSLFGLKMVGGMNLAIGIWRPFSLLQIGARHPHRPRPLGIIVASASSSSSSNPNSNPNPENEKEKASSSSSSSSSFLSRSQTYALLKQQMAVAAKSEDYKVAARIRMSLKSFEEEEPVLRLHGLMNIAVEEERFEDVARYRDELKIVAPRALLKCSSNATTLGIRVQVYTLRDTACHPRVNTFLPIELGSLIIPTALCNC